MSALVIEMNMTHHFKFKTAMLALVALACLGSNAWAARLMRFAIEVDGKLLLNAYQEDNSDLTKAEVWSRLRGKGFEIEKGAKLPLESPGATLLKLKGEVVLRLTHARSTLAEAKLTELTLTRKEGTGNEWLLSGEEVQRTATVAGLGTLPEVKPKQEGMPTWVWVSGSVTLVLILLSLVTRLMSKPDPTVTS